MKQKMDCRYIYKSNRGGGISKRGNSYEVSFYMGSTQHRRSFKNLELAKKYLNASHEGENILLDIVTMIRKLANSNEYPCFKYDKNRDTIKFKVKETMQFLQLKNQINIGLNILKNFKKETRVNEKCSYQT